MTGFFPSGGSVGFQPTVYLQHLIGLTALLAWQARWDAMGSPLRMDGPVLETGPIASQRFALGFPSEPRYGPYPFLAVQPDETVFFRRLQWADAWCDAAAGRLVLTTRKVMGDGVRLEDLPAMALAIEFDRPEKTQSLATSPRLAMRPLWFDAEGAHVAGGAPMANLPLRPAVARDQWFPEGALSPKRSLRELVDQQLAEGNRFEVAFRGAPAVVAAELQDLVTPFRPDSVPKMSDA